MQGGLYRLSQAAHRSCRWYTRQENQFLSLYEYQKSLCVWYVAGAVYETIMGAEKKVLTTGDVAKICCVAPRTVSKWFDSGQLRGYRIPGSKDRRIPLEHLVRFMRTHGIPLNGLDIGKKRILVLDNDHALCDALKNTLTEEDGYEVYTSSTAFEAGSATQMLQPNVLLVDVHLPDVEPQSISRFFRSEGELRSVLLIGTGHDLCNGSGQSLLQHGFDGYLSKPFTIRELIELIDSITLAVEPTPTL